MKVRYYGHFNYGGYSRAAFEMCMSLIRAGVDLEIRPFIRKGEYGIRLDNIPPEMATRLRADSELKPVDVAIVHDLPMDCARVRGIVQSDLGNTAVGKWVAYTTWEAQTAPVEMIDLLRKNFDQVWVPSRVNQSAFAAGGFIAGGGGLAPIRVMPHAFDEETALRRQAAHVETSLYRFLYVGAWNSRKNPAGLLRAWALAFTPDSPVELVLQCGGASAQTIAAGIAQTGLLPQEMAKVTPVNVMISDDKLASLYSSADCFVSAARGEAWNLGAFDAMLARKHVITVRGLGSDDYLEETSADLVHAMRAPANVDVRPVEGQGFSFERVGAQGMTSRDVWLEPNLTQIASCMRGVANTSRASLRVSYEPVDRYGYLAVAKLALHHLEQL